VNTRLSTLVALSDVLGTTVPELIDAIYGRTSSSNAIAATTRSIMLRPVSPFLRHCRWMAAASSASRAGAGGSMTKRCSRFLCPVALDSSVVQISSSIGYHLRHHDRSVSVRERLDLVVAVFESGAPHGKHFLARSSFSREPAQSEINGASLGVESVHFHDSSHEFIVDVDVGTRRTPTGVWRWACDSQA
jgi:hypothetical protein